MVSIISSSVFLDFIHGALTFFYLDLSYCIFALHVLPFILLLWCIEFLDAHQVVLRKLDNIPSILSYANPPRLFIESFVNVDMLITSILEIINTMRQMIFQAVA